MPIRTMSALLLTLAMAACNAAQPTAPEQAPQMPPPGASGKLSPDMVGKVSPVPAFMGLGEHFSIEIQSQGGQTADGMRHRVRLVRGMGSEQAEGTLYYRGSPGPSRGAPIMLQGSLDTAKGQKTMLVEIATEACTDDADIVHPQRVKIALQGEPQMNGCGDLAVY